MLLQVDLPEGPLWTPPEASATWQTAVLGHLADIVPADPAAGRTSSTREGVHYVYTELHGMCRGLNQSGASLEVEMPDAAPGLDETRKKIGSREDPSTWYRHPNGRGPSQRPAWHPLINTYVKAAKKETGWHLKRDNRDKVFLDWGIGEWVRFDHPLAAKEYVNPKELREAKERAAQLQKKQQASARRPAARPVPHARLCDKSGRPIFETAPAAISQYNQEHEAHKDDIRYGRLVQSNVSNVPTTMLEQQTRRANIHLDEPRFSALSARRVELYEHKLNQMTTAECVNCSRRPLLDSSPRNLANFTCEKCLENAHKLSDANHMNPAPRGRPLQVWDWKKKDLLGKNQDSSWLPPEPPHTAQYPPVYYEATALRSLRLCL